MGPHTLKIRPGEGGQIPEMIQVCDYDILIVIVELHTLIYMRPLNEWQNLKLSHFEVGNLGPKMTLFCNGRCFRVCAGVIKQNPVRRSKFEYH